jgi:hypothetical protein
MGQTITVSAAVVDDVAVFDTNRSLTGQDGGEFAAAEEAAAAAGFDAELAARLFGSDPAIEHVYVLSNALTVRRSGGWDDSSLDAAGDVIREFFVFYSDG